MPTSDLRIVVSGTTGSGKTELARRLATALDLDPIDLDELHWGPNWTPRPEFRDETERATRGQGWVAAGNYSAVRDLTWGRATHVVWLDYPAPVVFGRLLKRTLTRIATKEALFGGNRETVRVTFFSRDSLLLWFFRTHWSRRRTYPPVLATLDAEVVELRSPAGAEHWLAGFLAAATER